MKFLIKTPPFLMMLLLTGCATNGHGQTDFCSVGKPIYLSSKDDITGDTARQIDYYDDKGHVLCGWSYAQ